MAESPSAERRPSHPGRGHSRVSALTPRQREVLALMAEGRSNASIAGALFLSQKAVVQHTSNIYDALGIPLDAHGHRRVLAVIDYLSTAEGEAPPAARASGRRGVSSPSGTVDANG